MAFTKNSLVKQLFGADRSFGNLTDEERRVCHACSTRRKRSRLFSLNPLEEIQEKDTNGGLGVKIDIEEKV